MSKGISAKNYQNELTIADQQFDNSVKLARNDVDDAEQRGINNAEDTYAVNRMNPYFKINPTNGRIFFEKGKGPDALAASQGSPSDYFTAYKNNFQKYLNEIDASDVQGAREFAQWMTGMKGKSNNDDALAMLRMYARQA
jgi:hypothetical protein